MAFEDLKSILKNDIKMKISKEIGGNYTVIGILNCSTTYTNTGQECNSEWILYKFHNNLQSKGITEN